MIQEPHQQARKYLSRFGLRHHGAVLRCITAAAFCVTIAACSGGGGGSSGGGTVTHTVTATAGTGGAISPSSAVVNDSSTTSFTVASNTGYTIASVTGCNGSLSGATYTTGAITADCTVTASFTAVSNTHTVTATAGTGGTITPSSAAVNDGSTTNFTVTPDSGYAIDTVTGCGGSLNGSTYTTAAVTADCTVTASFVATHTVTATAGTGGTITPSSAVVNDGSTTSFTVTPDVNYAVSTVTGCSGSLNGTTYTTGAVTADCTVSATFMVVNQWTWVGGSDTVAAAGVYGTQGMANTANIPGARDRAATWIDASGHLWLFGGYGYDSGGTPNSLLNDLWEYDPVTNQWTWIGGSKVGGIGGIYGTQGTPASGNIPGGRYGAVSWIDGSGKLWLFGGFGLDSTASTNWLNDLWVYNPATNQWTWMDGSKTGGAPGVYGSPGVASPSNIPGARYRAVVWADTSGHEWLFGGRGYDSTPSPGALGYLNDLWEYDPATNEWTWMGGSDTVSAIGVYGTQGVPGGGNVPGARYRAAAWADGGGHFWLFGGYGRDSAGNTSLLNDLWEYDPSINQWMWVGGSDTFGAKGSYGTQGVADMANIPGARNSASFWSDANGHLWLFGGNGLDSSGAGGELNDLWQYELSTNQWTWVSGSNTIGTAGTYGTQGVANANNVPGARDSAGAWIDGTGHLWLFGGTGIDSASSQGQLNDLWEFQP